MARVRMNRDDPDVAFLSNKVKGDAEQITPNGCAYSYDGEKKNPARIGGSVPSSPSSSDPFDWKGIRSGE